MQKIWKERNVDLELLATRIGEFFKAKDFEAIRGETPLGYQIFAEDSPYFKIDGYISVAIEGNPDDFVVKINLCKKTKRQFTLLGIFSETMFLGGYFLSRKLKSDEEWLRLEAEFWRHVENSLLSLNNSAKNLQANE
jgi:hypothetical protein